MKVASFYASSKKSCAWFDFVLWCKISFIVPSLSHVSLPPSLLLPSSSLPPSSPSSSVFLFYFALLGEIRLGLVEQWPPKYVHLIIPGTCFVVVVQLLSRVWLCIPVGLQCARLPCPSLSPRVCSNSSPLSWWNQLFLFCSLLLLLSIFPITEVFSNESVLRIKWPNYWSFSFSISPSNEYSGLISFRTDWFDLLAVQQTLKSLLQHHNSNLYYLIW